MYKGKTFLAIIPARGGSKGIPQKNIKLLAGKPLIAWTIQEAKKSKYIDRIILSSEDAEIIKIAKDYGCEVPFVRPKELASDLTPGIEPVLHALETLPEKYDFVVLLQPTSPLRSSIQIDIAIEFIIENMAESLVSISKVKKSPVWMFSREENFTLKPILPEFSIKRRQDAPIFHELNGAIYITTSSFLQKEKTFMNEQTIGFLMDANTSVDIDDKIDWMLVELMIKEIKVK